MELIEVNAAMITILAFLVTAVMAAITKLGLVVGENSANNVKRLAVLVLSVGAVVGVNYTQFLNIDFSGDIVKSVTQVVELVTAVWFASTGVYESVWDTLATGFKKLFGK